MFRLVAIEDTTAASSAPLVDGARLGRLATCAFVIAHPSVSRVHARVERRGGAWFLVDEGSRNGLHVRGERVGEIRLDDGLELRVGEFALRVVAEPGATVQAAIAESFEFDVPAAAPDAGPLLEDPAEIEIGGGAAAHPRQRPAGATRPATPEPSGRSAAQVRQAEFLAEEARARSGLVRGELTQQPFWIQGLVWLFVLAVAAAVAWGVVTVLG